jgi:hypothetical protein
MAEDAKPIVWGADTIVPKLIYYFNFSSVYVSDGELDPAAVAHALDRAVRNDAHDEPDPDLRGLPVHLWRDDDR